MIQLNKYIFYDICNKNIDIYNEYISTLRSDYLNVIIELKNADTYPKVRVAIHKLVSIISIFNDTENVLTFICKNILDISKNNTDFSLYEPYIQIVLDFDKRKLGL